MKTPCAPLACPGLAESRESFIERVGMWLPIIGWGAASLAYDLRVRPYVRDIKRQMLRRPVFPTRAWGNDQTRVQFAQWICSEIRDEFEWPNDHFCPADPVELACWGYIDGLATIAFQMTIEDRIGCKLSDQECEELTAVTLGKAVDYLLAKAQGPGS